MLSYCVSCHSTEHLYGIPSSLRSSLPQELSCLYLTLETSQEVSRECRITTCIFHKANNSQWGQDVVATPRTTTMIYTPWVQAEPDVGDLKTEICKRLEGK